MNAEEPVTVTDVDRQALLDMADTLDGRGSDLFTQASALQSGPDAGASTDLVANAMFTLATVIAGLAGRIGDLAESTRNASGTYVATDAESGGTIWTAL